MIKRLLTMHRPALVALCTIFFLLSLPSAYAQTYELNVGDSRPLYAPNPPMGTLDNAEWSCTNSNVWIFEKGSRNESAEVKVANYFSGTATVTCSVKYTWYDSSASNGKHYKNGYTSKTYYISAKPTEIKINKTSEEIEVWDDFELSYTTSPSGLEPEVEWTTSDSKVAIFDDGYDSRSNLKTVSVTGRSEGTCVIKLRCNTGYPAPECIVTVVDNHWVKADVTGSVKKGTKVTLSSTKAGATIYYTTDGTEPSKSSTSTKYSSPIEINEDMTIKAKAYLGNQESKTSTFKYSVVSHLSGEIFKAKTIEGVELSYVVKSSSSGFYLEVSSGKTYTPAIDKNYSGKITIPNKVDGIIVYNIGERAFYDCNITNVVFEEYSYASPKTIRKESFRNCKNLKSVSFPHDISLETMAFYNCSALENIVFEGYANYGAATDMFNNCNSLKEIHLKWSSVMKEIKDNCFSEQAYNNAILYVPENLMSSYSSTNGWKKFKNRVAIGSEQNKKLTLNAEPLGGEVAKGTTVTLTAKADGSTVSGCDIYYTLNGSSPTKDSTPYTSSGITINESCTLKAIAYKDGYETSEVITVYYSVIDGYANYIYYIGTTDGWNRTEQRLKGSDGYFSGFLYCAGQSNSNEFKFQTEAGNWDTEINTSHFSGGIYGDLSDGGSGSNIRATAGDGVYYVEANLTKGTLKGTFVHTMGIIGDFNEWSDDVVMSWNADDYCYEVTGAGVTANGWKFRVNRDWIINLGGTIDNLDYNGPNIEVIGNTIKLYPTRKNSDNIYCTVEGNVQQKKLTLTASPNGGQVSAGTKVTLTAKADGSTVSGCDIYYTLNGSTPTKNSIPYTSSGITINESCTLKAIAYKDGYETSRVLTATYTVNASDTSGDGSLSNPFNATSATKKARELGVGETSSQSYYVKGKISSIKYAFNSQSGTATFYISDDGTTENQFYVYGSYYLENRPWVDGNSQIQVGDNVIVYGKMSNYNGILEMADKQNYIYSHNGNTNAVATCAEVVAGTDGTVYRVSGKVKSIENTTYGNWYLEDSTGDLYIYGTKDKNGNTGKNNSIEDWGIEIGDNVIVEGARNTYHSIVELVDVTVINIKKNVTTGDGSFASPFTCVAATNEAGKLREGETSSHNYYVKGIISSIKHLYNSQYGTATFYISDDGTTNGQFYVYGSYYLENKPWEDGNPQVAIGDDVIVYGKMTNYNGILEMADKQNHIYSHNGNTKVTNSPKDINVILSSSGYATFYSSESAYKLPSGLTAKVVSDVYNGKLIYKTLSGVIIPKRVAVMIESSAKKSSTYTLSITTESATYNGTNLLNGSDETTTTTGNGYHYKLSYGPSGTKWDDVFGWYWGAQNGSPFQIDGHKAWLVVPRSATTRGYTIDGDATGIIDIGAEREESVYYDMQGRRIYSPSNSGVYIRNGKKIIIK